MAIPIIAIKPEFGWSYAFILGIVFVLAAIPNAVHLARRRVLTWAIREGRNVVGEPDLLSVLHYVIVLFGAQVVFGLGAAIVLCTMFG